MNNDLSGEFILKNNVPAPASTEISKSKHITTHAHPDYPDIRHRSTNFLTSLCIDPENVKIVSQDVDEDLHVLVRRHHITNLPWIALVIVLLFVPLFTGYLFSFTPIPPPSPSVTIGYLLLYYVALFGYTVLKFSEWYFHVGLITNKRLVDVDMHNILSKNVAETEIAAVEDVSYVQKGILQSIFHYGTVSVQTEAVQANFEFDKIPRPSQVAEIINQLAVAAREEKGE